MTDEPKLLEINEGEIPDLLIPCGDGAVWIPDPLAFCTLYGYEALKTDEFNLYGLRGNSWHRIGTANLTVVQ